MSTYRNLIEAVISANWNAAKTMAAAQAGKFALETIGKNANLTRDLAITEGMLALASTMDTNTARHKVTTELAYGMCIATADRLLHEVYSEAQNEGANEAVSTFLVQDFNPGEADNTRFSAQASTAKVSPQIVGPAQKAPAVFGTPLLTKDLKVSAPNAVRHSATATTAKVISTPPSEVVIEATATPVNATPTPLPTAKYPGLVCPMCTGKVKNANKFKTYSCKLNPVPADLAEYHNAKVCSTCNQKLINKEAALRKEIQAHKEASDNFDKQFNAIGEQMKACEDEIISFTNTAKEAEAMLMGTVNDAVKESLSTIASNARTSLQKASYKLVQLKTEQDALLK